MIFPMVRSFHFITSQLCNSFQDLDFPIPQQFIMVQSCQPLLPFDGEMDHPKEWLRYITSNVYSTQSFVIQDEFRRCGWIEGDKECGMMFSSHAEISAHLSQVRSEIKDQRPLNLLQIHLSTNDSMLHVCEWNGCDRRGKSFKVR